MENQLIVFKYLPERIDMDPLLGLEIHQPIITERNTLNFESTEVITFSEVGLNAEPFREEIWKDVILQRHNSQDN